MGLIGAAFGLGFTFGPMIGGIMSRISYGAPFYFAAGLAAVNVVLLYFILPESLSEEYRSKPHVRTKFSEVFQHGHARFFGTIVVTYFFTITGFAIMTTLFALLTEKHFGYDARQTGYLFGFIGIISVILQGGLIGRLVKTFGETALARTGLLLLAGSMVFMPLVHSLPTLLVVCGSIAIANGLVNPTLNGPRLAIDRSQLAGPRDGAHASSRQRGSPGRTAARRLAADVRSAFPDRALRAHAALRERRTFADRVPARAVFRKPASDHVVPGMPVQADA